MAKPGEELRNPVTGQDLVFRRTTAETAGELLEVESSWASATMELAKPPGPVQRIVFGVLAPVARLLGHRGRYLAQHSPA
jgi:hypothetical protein